ncbi:hypothetical protein KCU78_g522, partial [Aureobasidium melanogenum]
MEEAFEDRAQRVRTQEIIDVGDGYIPQEIEQVVTSPVDASDAAHNIQVHNDGVVEDLRHERFDDLVIENQRFVDVHAENQQLQTRLQTAEPALKEAATRYQELESASGADEMLLANLRASARQDAQKIIDLNDGKPEVEKQREDLRTELDELRDEHLNLEERWTEALASESEGLRKNRLAGTLSLRAYWNPAEEGHLGAAGIWTHPSNGQINKLAWALRRMPVRIAYPQLDVDPLGQTCIAYLALTTDDSKSFMKPNLAQNISSPSANRTKSSRPLRPLTMATGPRSFLTATSSSANPVFYDPIYYGYIPTDPPPDFTLPKPISEMLPAEKTQTLKDFAKRQRDALKEEEDKILKDYKFWRDKYHKDMIVAHTRGLEFLAEAIIKRDADDNYTDNRGSLPTKPQAGPGPTNRVSRLAQMLAVLFSMPSDVIQALLRGNFPALVRDVSQPLKAKVPHTPTRTSTSVDKANRKPYIYILHLVNRSFTNPNMQKMKGIMEYAKAYVRNVRSVAGENRPKRVIKDGVYTATAQELEKVFVIDRVKRKNDGNLFEEALTAQRFKTALQEGKTRVNCLYITSNSQLKGINKIIELTEAGMAKLQQEGWNPASPDPLPSTIASAGWTADAGKRRNDYYTHSGINGKIRIFDAIGRCLGYEGLSWQCLLLVWNKNAVSMAEHIAHVLGGTYVIQGGMNGEAAGISVRTADTIPRTCYKELERRLLNSSHWSLNRDATDDRNTTTLTSINNLPHYLRLKKEVNDASVKENDLKRQLEKITRQRLDKEKAEIKAFNRRIQSTGQLLEDIDELDKQLKQLKLIRDTIYAVKGVREFVHAAQEPDTTWIEPTQVPYSLLTQIQSLPRAEPMEEELEPVQEPERVVIEVSSPAASQSSSSSSSSPPSSGLARRPGGDDDGNNDPPPGPAQTTESVEESDAITGINYINYNHFNGLLVGVQRSGMGEEVMSYDEVMGEGSRRVEEMVRNYYRNHADAPRPPDYESSESESDAERQD